MSFDAKKMTRGRPLIETTSGMRFWFLIEWFINLPKRSVSSVASIHRFSPWKLKKYMKEPMLDPSLYFFSLPRASVIQGIYSPAYSQTNSDCLKVLVVITLRPFTGQYPFFSPRSRSANIIWCRCCLAKFCFFWVSMMYASLVLRCRVKGNWFCSTIVSSWTEAGSVGRKFGYGRLSLTTELSPAWIASLARLPGNIRRTAAWISRHDNSFFFDSFAAVVARISAIAFNKELITQIDFDEIANFGWSALRVKNMDWL